MFSVPDKLFYVRELQLKFYFNKNKSVKALFFLEKFLFENYKFQEEIPLTVLKQKWIYECINKNDFSAEITKPLKILSTNKLKKLSLKLIELFGNIPNISDKENFFESFKKFNIEFNLVLKLFKKTFNTSLDFQFSLLKYVQRFSFNLTYIESIKNKEKEEDFFESVFLKIFLNKGVFKISKVHYLFNLLKELIKK
tara:strand:+ start:21 stop:608 length:588 start_codon:yes stop_codon:yes gene_type:complete